VPHGRSPSPNSCRGGPWIVSDPVEHRERYCAYFCRGYLGNGAQLPAGGVGHHVCIAGVFGGIRRSHAVRTASRRADVGHYQIVSDWPTAACGYRNRKAALHRNDQVTNRPLSANTGNHGSRPGAAARDLRHVATRAAATPLNQSSAQPLIRTARKSQRCGRCLAREPVTQCRDRRMSAFKASHRLAT
jgi:hypothetical protein